MAITRQQQKRKEVAPESAGSPPPKRPRHDGNTRRQQTRKEVAPGSAGSPPPKRPQQDGNTRCAFLALPRELRDEIYKHVLESDSSVTMNQRNFITKSGLVGTNSQICSEYLDAVLYYAPVIHTTVRNHNFAHVVTFLNRLSDAQFTRLKSNATAKSPQRKIWITLTYSHTKQSTKPQLNRWLNRFDDPNRRGAEIEFGYLLDRESWGKGGYKQRPHVRETAGPRSKEEMIKMRVAMRSICRNGGFW